MSVLAIPHRTMNRQIRGRLAVPLMVTTLAVGAVLTASPAQARPRSCQNIAGSIMFFQLAVEMDTGPYARYLANDQRWLSYNLALYARAGC